MKEFFLALVNLLKGNFLSVFCLSLVSLFDSLINLLLPIIFGQFINELITSADMQVIVKFCCTIALLNVISSMFSFVEMRLNLKIQMNVSNAYNLKILKKLSKIDLLYLEKQDQIYLNQRINNDVNAMTIFSINLFKDFVVQIITLIVSIYLLIFINKSILFILIIVIVVYMFGYHFVKPYLLQSKKLVLESQSQYFSKLGDYIKYVNMIKSFNKSNFIVKPILSHFLELKSNFKENQNYTFIMSGGEKALYTFADIGVYILVGIQLIKKKITIGIFTVTSSYFDNVIGSIKFFSSLYQEYLNTYVSYQRIKEIENMKDDNVGKIKINIVDKISVKNFCFSYGDVELIKNLNLTFKKGVINIIVGDNGSGKSTFIKCLCGLYGSYTGEIYYNMNDLKELDQYNLRENNIGYVEQNPLLFRGTVLDNICINKVSSIDKIIEYLINFNLIDVKNDAYTFLNKCIDENTVNFSGGEAQKICIIRELLNKKDVIIFDEPTSSLDKNARDVFLKNIDNLKENHIIIVITHDIELVKRLNSSVFCIESS